MQYDTRQTFEHGRSVDPETGLLRSDEAYAVNVIPVRLPSCSRLIPKDPALEYRCCYYSPETEDRLIYTYDYQPEANWTTYIREESEGSFAAGCRTADTDRFVRVILRETDIEEETAFGSVFSLEPAEVPAPAPAWMTEETEATCARAAAAARPGDAVFLLLTDSHYSAGCIWEDTVASLAAVAERLQPDGLIHLGDLTDGMLSSRHTMGITGEMLKDLRRACNPLYLCLGNHDLNYFRGNPDRMTKQQGAAHLLGEAQPWYYKDLPDRKLRLLFLDSFDPEDDQRYGFDEEEAEWVRRVLRKVPKGYRVLVFSHVTPLPENHVWSIDIRNSSRIMRALEQFNQKKKHSVIGWIYGHNHADQVISYRDFPLISIGCSKLEAFEEHKPEDAVTYDRKKGTRTQELWDVLLVHADGGMDLIRYGAGKDRHIAEGNRQNDQFE